MVRVLGEPPQYVHVEFAALGWRGAYTQSKITLEPHCSKAGKVLTNAEFSWASMFLQDAIINHFTRREN